MELPVAQTIKTDTKEGRLYHNVLEALSALPFHFESKTVIEGLEAGDLFSLNSVLGGTIELQVVATLNKIRSVWDPDDEWEGWGFRRFTQTFPDVRLVNSSDRSSEPAIGLELKGWYLLSKEAELSFRFEASARVCADIDMLVVVPWHLGDVLSGTPEVISPFVTQAKFAAQMRSFYWQETRRVKRGTDVEIIEPEGVIPYPAAKTSTSDKPTSDSGKNFGRIARVGLMDDFIRGSLNSDIAGISAKHWINFFRVFTDGSDPDDLTDRLNVFLSWHDRNMDQARAEEIVEHISAVAALMGGESPQVSS